MTRWHSVGGALLLMLAVGCHDPAPPPGRSVVSAPRDDIAIGESALMERGMRAVGQAFRALTNELAQAMAAGGPTNAILVCSKKAPVLLASAGESNQVQLRRVSHKARHPASRAQGQELELIRQFQADVAAGRTPAPLLLAQPGTAALFVPIVINHPVCLNCHGLPGTNVTLETMRAIKQLYPQDEGTGFKFGDVRGLWRVDFKER